MLKRDDCFIVFILVPCLILNAGPAHAFLRTAPAAAEFVVQERFEREALTLPVVMPVFRPPIVDDILSIYIKIVQSLRRIFHDLNNREIHLDSDARFQIIKGIKSALDVYEKLVEDQRAGEGFLALQDTVSY